MLLNRKVSFLRSPRAQKGFSTHLKITFPIHPMCEVHVSHICATFYDAINNIRRLSRAFLLRATEMTRCDSPHPPVDRNRQRIYANDNFAGYFISRARLVSFYFIAARYARCVLQRYREITSLSLSLCKYNKIISCSSFATVPRYCDCTNSILITLEFVLFLSFVPRFSLILLALLSFFFSFTRAEYYTIEAIKLLNAERIAVAFPRKIRLERTFNNRPTAESSYRV